MTSGDQQSVFGLFPGGFSLSTYDCPHSVLPGKARYAQTVVDFKISFTSGGFRKHRRCFGTGSRRPMLTGMATDTTF